VDRVRGSGANIGSDAFRNFTAIGHTTDLATRLQSAAPPAAC
jgi:class 3 adenylate cyclase